ncbi:MAG: 2-oxoglutarate oxidoreductase subunit KorA [Microgenomates group bacterium ADurb.Bin219]|nr:MAG: 2-oxoglutarate oxidoreductase subunit KorA [Microgenomates group bacterium ADurb.Bin219]HNP89064.1 2-oxoacid:acceptor oxidoreductase family protein [Candidatus Woesebacteria bacterium]
MKMKGNFSLKISGPAGTGIMRAGETFSKALNRLGFYTLVYPEYPSQIRGGDNNLQIVFSSEPVNSPNEKIDLLLAFNSECLKNHRGEVKKAGRTYELGELGIKVETELVKNSATLGFLWKILGFDLKVLEEQLREDFKEEKIFKLNLSAARSGFSKGKDVGLRIWKGVENRELGRRKGIINLTGNEALVRGILVGQCGFAAIYPMTPINAVLTELSKSIVTVFRPEDEVAGILAAIGASYAGKRAMVATSGGGFSLMTEGLGMAGIAEIPLVIVLGQRAGPSTGMATYSSQADLNFAIYAGQGEFPRIILAPGDLQELYRFGAEAFNLAEEYQVPVILMTDKYLAESRFSANEGELKEIKVLKVSSGVKNPEDYKRYQLTKSGISPRAFPGQTAFLTNSYEHDEKGFSTDEAEMRNEMMEKRRGKLSGLKGGFEKYGEEGKRGTLVSWGSTKGILLDFIKENPDYNLIHFWRPWPFPQEVTSILKKVKKIIAVEGNYSGQMADLIELKTGLKVQKILKDDGRPFFKEELEQKILKLKC